MTDHPLIVTLIVPFPSKHLSVNRTPRQAIVLHSIRAKYKEHCQLAIRAQLRDMRLPAGKIPLKFCRCTYEFRRVGIHRQDSDNANLMMKGAMDACEAEGVIVNDRYVEYNDPIWKTQGPEGRCVFITLTEVRHES